MYKDSRTDVCIIPYFNLSLHRVWFMFRTVVCTFRTAEYTFTTAERRNRSAEHKTDACSMEMPTGNAKYLQQYIMRQ